MKKDIDKELRQVKCCLKEKDGRIGVLETSLEYLGKKREDLIRWFNFLCVIGFVVAICVLIGVSAWFYPDAFSGVLVHFAIVGMVVILSNIVLSCFARIFYDDIIDIGDMFIFFNSIVVPVFVGVYVYCYGFTVL